MKIRIAALLFLALVMNGSVISQTPKKKSAVTKNDIQSEMNGPIGEIKKQIADLEKQLKSETDPEIIKDLKEQIAALQKELNMMQGLNKSLSGMSDKVIHQATEEEPVVPKKDATRINSLPKKILTEAELSLFIKNVHAGVEKMIPVVERTEALNIYNETKAKYKSTAIIANAASGCWMLGHWEKALFIMGKACMDSIADADNLNNYAAFLVMTGGEQAAIPILQYLNKKYPDNSTIQNNIGQAWFGLGEMDNAKKYLDSVTILYPNHSMANSTLAKISLGNKDSSKAISYLKSSLKGSYDPDKEVDLEKLGYTTTYSDLPPFNYPMTHDPFGLIPLINLIPQQLQTNVEEPEPAYALERFLNGVRDFKDELNTENVALDEKLGDRAKKLAYDSTYRVEFLEPYNCPAYLLAGRSVQLLTMEGIHLGSPLITQLWLPDPNSFNNSREIPLPLDVIVRQCFETWDREVIVPLGILAVDANTSADNCAALDAQYNAYLAKRAAIYNRGVDLIKKEFIQKSKRLDAWILLNLYGTTDEPPKKANGYTYALVEHMQATVQKESFQNQHYTGILGVMEWTNKYFSRARSACQEKNKPDPKQGSDDIKKHRVKKIECEYVKKIVTPVYYEFELKCNTITEKTNSKLRKRKPDIQKGAAENSTATSHGSGPFQSRGPQIFFFTETNQQSFAPLCLENKTTSQFSLEYDKSGNLVGFNFQLNEDGTALKDPESVESGVDSRWTWNAIGSPKKGYMNRLLFNLSGGDENPVESRH
jgi:tetratricopeptide (TPR) repeat protein